MEFAKKIYIPTHILPSPVIVPIAPIYVKDASKCASCMDDVIVFYRSILHRPGPSHTLSCS